MRIASTRNRSQEASFSTAILDCIPPDGGLYTLYPTGDFRPWLHSMTKTMSFSAIAALLTQILTKNEFSPAVAEAIAHRSLTFSPEIRRLDRSLYLLELFHGPTGWFRDFGFSYLVSCFEHFLQMRGRNAVIVAVSTGSFAASMAWAFRGRKRLRALTLFPAGTMRGFTEEDCVWNGGNLYPVEVDAGRDRCFALADELLHNQALVEKYSLTVANTTNIGRLLPDMFCYFYAFTRIKNAVHSDIFYAVNANNYSAITGGLYAWRLALPVNGFITNCTAELTLDARNQAQVADAIVPLEKRTKADPALPSSLERLEALFKAEPAVLRGLVFPARVDEGDTENACKELFMRYGVFADMATSRAYASALKRADQAGAEGDTVILVAQDHPAHSADGIRHYCGEAPEMPERIARQNEPVEPRRRIGPRVEELERCLREIQ
ncbi:MAG: threonine synthase [Spirochaetaceae bacterium]|jgi:threonine synthase|nr:threonine synthase [Spirochaetaceae bacterium]